MGCAVETNEKITSIMKDLWDNIFDGSVIMNNESKYINTCTSTYIAKYMYTCD